MRSASALEAELTMDQRGESSHGSVTDEKKAAGEHVLEFLGDPSRVRFGQSCMPAVHHVELDGDNVALATRRDRVITLSEWLSRRYQHWWPRTDKGTK